MPWRVSRIISGKVFQYASNFRILHVFCKVILPQRLVFCWLCNFTLLRLKSSCQSVKIVVSVNIVVLTLIWVRWGELPSLSKTRQNYGRKFSSRKYTFQCQGALNFSDVRIFVQKVSVFWTKQYRYTKQQCETCVRDFLSSVFSFCKIKGYY